jgi:hypothetical protein
MASTATEKVPQGIQAKFQLCIIVQKGKKARKHGNG